MSSPKHSHSGQGQPSTAITFGARDDLRLRDLFHRTKNNFQTILSFIQLQRRRVRGEEARDSLDRIEKCVTTIHLAQGLLSVGGGTGTVDVGSYLKTLCSCTGVGRDELIIEAQAQKLNVPVERAVAAGLIANEALHNALKHAFPNHRPGHIRLLFSANTVSRLCRLVIRDDGVGIREPRSGGTGLRLIRAMAEQLKGQFSCTRPPEGGTEISVLFPM
jgi:two-component system, sensor histidine kinase PdtaS